MKRVYLVALTYILLLTLAVAGISYAITRMQRRHVVQKVISGARAKVDAAAKLAAAAAQRVLEEDPRSARDRLEGIVLDEPDASGAPLGVWVLDANGVRMATLKSDVQISNLAGLAAGGPRGDDFRKTATEGDSLFIHRVVPVGKDGFCVLAVVGITREMFDQAAAEGMLGVVMIALGVMVGLCVLAFATHGTRQVLKDMDAPPPMKSLNQLDTCTRLPTARTALQIANLLRTAGPPRRPDETVMVQSVEDLDQFNTYADYEVLDSGRAA